MYDVRKLYAFVNKIKKALAYAKAFGVEDGARTHDPRNHKPML